MKYGENIISMKKRIPLYELITKLNLNASSKESYLNFYNVLIKTKELSDENILHKLSKNKLKNYLSEAKFYLNKLIVRALRIHYTINPVIKNGSDNFLSNLEKQKEIYIYFSKGLYKDAAILCQKYAKDWEESNDFAMLSFAYKKMHQIELIKGSNQTNNNKYFELYTELHQSNTEKSKYYYHSLKIEKDLQKIGQIRTKSEVETIKKYLYSEIMLNNNSTDIYYWFVKILCHFVLLNFDSLAFCFKQIDQQIKQADLKNEEIVNKIQLFSRLAYISISLNPDYYHFYKNKYLVLVSDVTYLSDMHKNMYQLNSKIMDSLFLFKHFKYDEMLKISIPELDIHNYIFEGAVMLHYVDLLIARGKAYFKLNNLDKAFDYFNFIIDNKVKLKAKTFNICNAFFHIWLIRYLSKEYKILKSISNRYKIFLSSQKINFELEKTLLKFMYSVSNNYEKKNVFKNIEKLIQSLKSLNLKPFEKQLINKLDILSYLTKLKIHD